MIDADYMRGITPEKCIEIARRWPENIIIAKDGERVIGFVGFGAYRDKTLPEYGEIFAVYVLKECPAQQALPARLAIYRSYPSSVPPK